MELFSNIKVDPWDLIEKTVPGAKCDVCAE